jgi:hypothetical protein
MAKKTTTVPATVSPLAAAIAADIKANLGANKSATEVSGAFDSQFPFPWALFKGNASAAKCGMSAAEFKLVRDTRTEYRDGWVAAGLKNFDGRWQYVTSLSVHAPTVEDKPTAAKTTEAKLEEALRAAYRHAVTLECEYTQQKMTDLLDFHGIELQDAES